MSDIAVFYLARLSEGLLHFQSFANSLRQHPAEIEYDLVIICKGFERRSEFALISSIFKGIPHRLFVVPDELGMDIHAYKAAAEAHPHKYMCFMNTFSQIRSNGWLKKLFDALSSPRVGMVGATGSFESLNNSYELIHRAGWLARQAIRYNPELYRSFQWIVPSPYHAASGSRRNYRRRLRRFLGDLLYNRPRLEELVDGSLGEWEKASNCGAPFHFAAEFPHFPNPHIRSNAFMVRRDDMVSARLADGQPKLACCAFESGEDGLSLQILKRGELLRVVGANGQAYEIPEWMNSGCFRSNDQDNLLIADNQTQVYEGYTEAVRETHQIVAWGSYLAGMPNSIYNIKFDDVRPLSEFVEPRSTGHKDRFLSIVIPTHNRLELALDAIKTVRDQDHQNWEVVVFDNASNEDVGKAIAALGDDRIRCERSDEFLPVTASWNRALNMARGEYVTLVGDDDGLAPGFFARILELADRFGEPDVIFSSLLQFFHPGVLPHKPLGVVQTLPTADFMARRDYPFVLDKDAARRAVDSSLGLHRTFMFNMPAFTVRRDFMDSLRRDGEVLHPPFPDYYFANLAFEKANRIVVEPRPIAFQGVSTSSFGFTLFNQKTDEGFKVLGHELMQDDLFRDVGRHLLPGPGYNSQYIMTMAHLAKAIGDPSRQPDFARYRRIQVFHFLASRDFPIRWGNSEAATALWKQLSLAEKLDACYIAAVDRLSRSFRMFKRRRDKIHRDMAMHAFTPLQYVLNEGDYLKNSEVFDDIRRGVINATGKPNRNRPMPCDTINATAVVAGKIDGACVARERVAR